MGNEKNTNRLLSCEGTAHVVGVSFPKSAGSLSATERRLNPAAIVGHFELASKSRRRPSLSNNSLGTFQCVVCGRWCKGGDFIDQGFTCGVCLRGRGKGGQGMR
jgi:hypothetical protein